jgi:acetyl esterase/lipase
VDTPALPSHTARGSGRHGRPVLVWVHGGGLTQDAGRDYDPAKLAAAGIVAVTINSAMTGRLPSASGRRQKSSTQRRTRTSAPRWS